jgi:hypothetical protein
MNIELDVKLIGWKVSVDISLRIAADYYTVS